MKKSAVMLLVLCLMLGGSFPAAAESTAENVWMYAISVGKADAILVSVEGHTVLVDTGYARSKGQIMTALNRMGVSALDAVFVTHLDKDHIGGLTWLAESDIPIGAWYASGMYMDVDSAEEHPMTEAAAIRGESVTFLLAGDEVSLGSAVLRVLAPMTLATDKDDNNSLVMMLESSQGRILLAGDMEYPEESQLLASGENLKCDVLKVANHGDDDTNSPAFTQAASPQIAVISTSTEEKAETPDPTLVAQLKNQGAEVYVTDECTGGILVRLSGGVASAERVNVPQESSTVSLMSAIPGEDLITLINAGNDAVDLSGWYMYSSRGNEMYTFPDGTLISAGATLTVGTNSSAEGSYDLLWPEKKVVHAKKEDNIFLYNASGALVSQVSNGL